MTQWTVLFLFLTILVSTIANGQTVPPEYNDFIKKGEKYLNEKNENAPHAYSAAFKTIGWKIILTENHKNDCYNAAQAWMMVLKPDSAFFYLDRIINKLSFTDFDRLINDPAFIPLRYDDRWMPLLTAHGQIDSNPCRLLDSLKKEDQKWRHLRTKIGNHQTDTISVEKVVRQIILTDSLIFIQIKKMFDKHGFLGYDKVGKEGSNNFWLLVQHADKHPSFQDSVLTKMKIEADKGNASLSNYAYLIDRVRVNTKQLQVYGTQMQLNSTKTSYEPLPTVEPDKLNDRRKQVGLKTIEEYIQTMNKYHYGELQKK